MTETIEALANNPIFFLVGGGFFAIAIYLIYDRAKNYDKERTSRERREDKDRDHNASMHTQMVDANKLYSESVKDIASATVKQTASIVELSTLIKHTSSKDK